MDPVLSYDFAEIEFSVRQEIHTTATRLNAALEDLRSRIEPLQTMWTRESAAAYRLEQDRWHRSAVALNDLLMRLGNAVRDGAGEIADTDRRAAGAWR